MGFKWGMKKEKAAAKAIDFNQEIKFGMKLIEFILPVTLLAGMMLICTYLTKTVTPEDIEVVRSFAASGTPFTFVSAFFLLATLIMIFGFMMVYPLVQWLVFKLTGGSLQEKNIKEMEAYQG